MMFLATVALLAVGAEISARSSSRESVRPPCPTGMIRAGNAVRTGYSADKVHGVHAGENMPDSALGMLRRFYAEYIAAWLRNGDNEEGLAILRRYLTPRLIGRLQRMYAEMELDYDPFLEAQDCDESVLENLRIEKDSVRTDVYRILLWDNFNREYRKAELLLRHGEDGYRIDGILSLPDRYTRDPD